MNIIQQTDTSYRIEVTAGDIELEAISANTEKEREPNGNPSGLVLFADIEISLTEEATDAIRELASSAVSMDMSMGDRLTENEFLRALFSMPIPVASIFDGEMPELEDEDKIQADASLASLIISREATFGTVPIGASDRYRLKFIPDARGMSVVLDNIETENNINETHPFALSSDFVISSLGEENEVVDIGVPSLSSQTTIEDKRVVLFTKTIDIGISDGLSRAIFFSGLQDREKVYDAYYGLFSLPLWRSGSGISVIENNSSSRSSHICGIDPSNRSVLYIPTAPLSTESPVGSTLVHMRGTVEVSYLVGDVQYPFPLRIGQTSSIFDICTNDQGWTDVGPVAKQYIGDVGIEGEDVIHSWTGRRTIQLVKENLSRIGQARLEN